VLGKVIFIFQAEQQRPIPGICFFYLDKVPGTQFEIE